MCRYSKSKTDDIFLVKNSSSARLPACAIFSFGKIDPLLDPSFPGKIGE